MLTNFCSVTLLTGSSINVKSDVSNEINNLFEKNDEKKKLIYKFLNEFKKEKEVEILTDGDVGYDSSIQELGSNKYLVGTGTEGFWFLKFDDNGLVVQANKLQDENGVDVSILTADGIVGSGSSIQSLKNNKYLIGTQNKGFWLLEFDNRNNQFAVNKIQGKEGINVSIFSGLDNKTKHIGFNSSIQSLENNKYLVGTYDKGFWLLEFNDADLVVQANKIEGSNVSDLTTDGRVGFYSSIQDLGNNKYLVGTGTKGFWFLKFNDGGLVVQKQTR